MSELATVTVMDICKICSAGGRLVEIPGLTFGLFLVHGSPCDCVFKESGWRITHAPTLRRLNNLQTDLSFDEAVAIATQLSVMRGWDFTVEAAPEDGRWDYKFSRSEWAAEASEAAQARVLAETRGQP